MSARRRVCPAPSWRRRRGVPTLWAARQRAAPRADGQLLFGIAQGGADPELRERSIEEIVALDFDGHALGGLSVGETRERMLDTVAWAAPLLPAEKARYFMGIGDPEGILEVIARGVDMFDCVLPTRLARTGTAVTGVGRLNLRTLASATIHGLSTSSATAPPAAASRARTSGISSISRRSPSAPAHGAQPPLPAAT